MGVRGAPCSILSELDDSTGQKVCFAGGLVVGTQFEIPDDPRIYRIERSHLIGCNRLWCSDCKSSVKHLDGLYLAGADYERIDLDDLYASDSVSDWDRFVAPGAQFRTYYCRCGLVSRAGLSNASHLDTANIAGWSCGGHPGAATELDAL